MHFNLQIVRTAINREKDKRFVICFKHAIEYCKKPNWEIQEEVDEFGGECDFRLTTCKVCYPKI